MICMDNACMHVDECFFSPTTLSFTELTSHYCLLDLLVIREFICWTPILIGRLDLEIQLDIVLFTWRVRIHSLCIWILPICNLLYTGYYYDEYTINSWAILVLFLCFVLLSLYVHTPFNLCNIIRTLFLKIIWNSNYNMVSEPS